MLEKIGLIFKDLRNRHRLRQREMGDLLGVSHSTIHYIEAGKGRIDAQLLMRLAENFDVDLHWLLTGQHYNQPGAQLTSTEQDLLNGYRAIPESTQQKIKQLIDDLAENSSNSAE